MQWGVEIKRIEGHHAVISFPDGGEIVIPLKYLPRGSREGDMLKIEIHFDPFSTLDRLLNEAENASGV